MSNPFSLPSPSPQPNPFQLDPGSTPILTQLPSSQAAFTKKYSSPDLQSALQSLNPTIRNSLIQYDLTRVQRGQAPLSNQQTLLALQTAISHQAATKPESPGFFSRLQSDVSSIIDVPHIIQGLGNEVTQLPNAPAKLGEVLGRGNPQDILGGLAEVPGLRLVPGVNTISTLANQGPGGLLEHPLLTALDVLPYAKPALGSLAEAAVSRLPATAERVATARAGLDLSTTNALRDELGLAETPTPSNARLAARTSPTIQALRSTPTAQWFSSRFGTMARDMAQLRAGEEATLRLQSSPETPISHPALTDSITPLRNAIIDAQQWQNLIPEPRRIELTDRMTLENRSQLLADPTLTDSERGFINGAAEHADAIANFVIPRDWGLTRVDGEIYTRDVGAQILNARKTNTRTQSVSSIRQAITDAEPSVAPTIDLTQIKSESIPTALREQLLRGAAYSYDAAGFDARPLLDVLNAKRGPNWREVGHGPALTALQSLIDNPQPRPLLSQQDLIDRLTPLSRSDPSYARVLQDVKRANFQGAARTFRETINSRTRHVNPESETILDSLRRGRDQQKFMDRTSKFTPQAAEKSASKLARVEARALPARFIPMVEKLRSNALFERFSTDPVATEQLTQGFPQLVSGLRDNPQVLTDIEKDVTQTVQQMRANGFDPTFVHRVSPGQISQINYPSITDTIRTPTQARARTTDATPYIHDASIAVSHQAVEALSRQATETFVNHFLSMFGQDEATALSPYLERGRQLAERDPSLTAAQHASQLMARELVEYSPDSIFSKSQARMFTVPRERTFIPKSVEASLKQMFADNGFKFSGVLDPVMNLFRMNVLAFAPRFHINNIGGGAMLAAVEDPRIAATALTRFNEVRNFVKSGDYQSIKGLPPGGIGFQPKDIIEWEHKASLADKVLAAHSFLGGKTMSRWMDESRQVAGKALGGVEKAADWSYELNGKVDDFYRAAAYLTGHDKALTAGMTAREAEAAGVALVRKILPEWDRATPFERNVVRSVFPFYTFARFILNYAYRYPMDHPFRIAVTSSIARNEMQEYGDWLPQRFASMFFLGHPDANGNVNALQLGAINPFQDVANYFSLAGITGKVNPVISSVLEAMGVDPSKGAQDLYPDIAYDPVTGSLRPSNPNLLSSFISNVIPQSQLITALIGQNKNFEGILRANPEAASSYLRSSLGLPNVFRSLNPNQEAFKAEVQRGTLESQVKSEALRTGDWSRAQQFPNLRAYFQQISVLMRKNPDLFKQYVTTGGSSAGDVLGGALAGVVHP